ncbi:hypothetical protein TNCV_805641 [Trichonephila clavipes]|nr:hypothetical protein TNCV_805641 [Trichonephila clavipes]
MALRTMDAAVVQKNSLRVDELLSKLATQRTDNTRSISIPRIEDFNHILKDKNIFKIDLVKAYYQIPIAEEDKEKLPSPPHLACTSSIL